MSQFLDAYSIQYWLESCPQAYLEDTEYGHKPGEKEPDMLIEDPFMREQAIGLTVQLIAGERCALAASSGLINSAPDYAAKTFLATQTLDEARHVEIFTRRLMDLGVKKGEVDEVVAEYANPNLVKFAEILLEKVDKGDFVGGVVGQNVVLEGMAFNVFEMLQAGSKAVNPKFAHTLTGTIADERRHVGFGENYIGKLIQQHPEKKSEVEQMQKSMSYYMLATFADRMRSGEAQEERKRARELAEASGRTAEDAAEWQGVDLASAAPEELEAALADTILKDFRQRLTRIGLEYQTPERP
jgi:hypothetical protein